MKLTKWMQVILIGVSVITLGACSAKKKNMGDTAVADANAAYNSGVQVAGAEDESRFGEAGGSGSAGGRASSKYVYYFNFDSDAVQPGDRQAIDSNANYIANRNKSKVMLEGHTDPRGSREYNIGLGERRAKSVAEIMTNRGVNPNQVRIVSYGAEKLAANGRTEQDFQLDRRVVLVYLQK